MLSNPFAKGDRIRLTEAGVDAYTEYYGPADLPATREATVTSAGRFGFDCQFDDGTLWEACGVGGSDGEPIYFERIAS